MSAFNKNIYLVIIITIFLVLSCAPKKKVRLSPEELDRYYGNLIMEAEKNPQALLKKEPEIKELLELQPDYALAHIAMGMIYLAREEPDQTISEMKEVIKNAKGNELKVNFIRLMAHGNLGNAFQMKGLYDLAIHEFKEVLAIDPKNEGAHLKLGQVYVAKQEFDKAIDEFKEAIKIEPNNEAAHYFLGWCYNNKNLTDLAIFEFNKALEINPRYPEAYNNRGLAWFKKGEYDRAIADYNKALEINPRYPDAYNYRGIFWYIKEEYHQAIADYNKALEIDPRYPDAYNNRGLVWFKKGEYDRAIADYNKALEINPQHPYAHNNRAIALDKRCEYESAMADYHEFKDKRPRSAEIYLKQGNNWLSKGCYDRAIADYNKALEINPSFVDAYNNRGIAWSKKVGFDYACSDFQKACELGNCKWINLAIKRGYCKGYNSKKSISSEIYLKQGDYWLNQGDYDRAIADYNKALEINPSFVDAYNNRGIAWSKKVGFDYACSDFQKACELGNCKWINLAIKRGYCKGYNSKKSISSSNGNRFEKILGDWYQEGELIVIEEKFNELTIKMNRVRLGRDSSGHYKYIKYDTYSKNVSWEGKSLNFTVLIPSGSWGYDVIYSLTLLDNNTLIGTKQAEDSSTKIDCLFERR